MRKVVYIFSLIFLFIPCVVLATSFSADDITINIDDSSWYVFTRDNIAGNDELDKLGISYDSINDVFQSNSAYLDAFMVYDDDSTIELIIAVKDTDIQSNLNRYSDSKIQTLAKKQAESVGIDNYEIYKSDKYVFIKLEYTSSGYNIIDYYTAMNGKAFTIKFQSNSSISSSEENSYDKIVDTINFKYISSYDNNKSSLSNNMTDKVIEAIAASALCSFGAWIYVKVKKIGKSSKQKNKNKKRNKQLNDSKYFKCSNCGAKVMDSATKCPKCGASFVDDEEELVNKNIDDTDEFTCSYCGASVKASEDKCPNCGALFIDEDEDDESFEFENNDKVNKTVDDKRTSAILDEDNNHKFKCDNCGALVDEDDIICPKCGEIFDEEENDSKRDKNNSKSDVDQKYNDLKKLKELLDNDIITKEEFEKEKKKILKD